MKAGILNMKISDIVLILMGMLFFLLAASADAHSREMSSRSMTLNAWRAYQGKNYTAAVLYVDECVEGFSEKAGRLQAGLSQLPPKEHTEKYRDLNDVATCLFIKGMVFKAQHKEAEAVKVFQNIIDRYNFARFWSLDGRNWTVAEAAKDQIIGMEKGIDFGNYTSEILTARAWNSLEVREYTKAIIYADKCAVLYGNKARQQQASLNEFASWNIAFDYWALNDVATCIFVKGKAFLELDRIDEAKIAFQEILKEYSFAQCYDPNGWFWKVSQGARDHLVNIELLLNQGQLTSARLTNKAWKALGAGRYQDVEIYARKCLDLYAEKAAEMQVVQEQGVDKKEKHDFWALNDVGTCLFILGRARYVQGDNKGAVEAFQEIVDKYNLALARDSHGNSWKPVEGARDQILLMKTGIGFGDYSSQTLTVKAWQAYDARKYDEVIVYSRKCIQLYKKSADDMQSALDEYAPGKKAYKFWALNDVGTCYFLLGESLLSKKEYSQALDAYKTLVNDYFYSQCWDPKGWFWKPALAAKTKIDQIRAEQDEKQF